MEFHFLSDHDFADVDTFLPVDAWCKRGGELETSASSKETDVVTNADTFRSTIGFLSLLLFLGLAHAAEPEADLDPKAREVLQGMSDAITGADTLRLSALVKVKVHAGGEVREQDTKGDLLLKRPNRLLLEVRGGKIPFTIASDGKKVFTLVPPLGAYTSKEAANDLDGIFQGVERNLVMQQLPFFGFLLTDSPYGFFVNDSSAVEYAGVAEVEGATCHRVRVVQEAARMDVYVESSGKSVVQRIVPDTSKLEASLQRRMPGVKVEMSIDFQDWASGEEIADEAFAYVPPDWAIEKESFMAPQRQDAAMELLGKEAPNLQVSLLDGTRFDLHERKGKNIVIIDFWASWCQPCLMALPILSDIAKEYENKGVVLVAVNVDGTPAEGIQAFMESRGFSFNAAPDQGGMNSGRYRVGPIPQTVIVGKDGIVQDVSLGLPPNLREEVSGKLDKLLSGQSLIN